jgi:ABC-type glycerol-3-phosphate transport system substrate-binding protein
MTRIRITTMAAVTAAALTLAACGGSDDTAEPAAPQTTEATPTDTETEPATTEAETEPSETETEAEPDVPVVKVEGGQPVGGVQTLTFESGSTVAFVVEADAPEEVHVHGYDVAKDVGPGAPAEFEFAADLEGIFEVELEHSAVQIIKLVVEP